VPGLGSSERAPARCFGAIDRPDCSHRPAAARTCSGVKFAIVPVPVIGGPVMGLLARLGVEAAIGGGAPPLLPYPRACSIKLAIARLLEFSGWSSEEVCGEIAGESEIVENRQDPTARTRRTRRTPPRLIGPVPPRPRPHIAAIACQITKIFQ
jgi:hypothetical protein